MSDKKKTQKQLIEDLTIAMEKLSRRIENLERTANPYDIRPRTRTKDCPHCNGTGTVEVNHPFQPYYSNDNYNGSSWGV